MRESDEAARHADENDRHDGVRHRQPARQPDQAGRAFIPVGRTHSLQIDIREARQQTDADQGDEPEQRAGRGPDVVGDG